VDAKEQELGLVVAVMPIDRVSATLRSAERSGEAGPFDRGDKCWAFVAINIGAEPIQIEVYSVSYEWGDFGNSEDVSSLCGPIAPGDSLVIYEETATEMRTTLAMTVSRAGRIFHVGAEVGRLYIPSVARGQQPIPELGGRIGKRAELSGYAAAASRDGTP
jgi:hypothetical protein